jgi:hypothetical protein
MRPLLAIMALAITACSSSDNANNAAPPPGGANLVPNLSGTPPKFAMQDLVYSFRPESSDADGDPLMFMITNKPLWATFDSATGALSGTPSSEHVGTYPGISISVSDGQASAELPTFDVEVVQSAAGSLTLSWTPPTLSADGTPLEDLDLYRVRWGTQTGDHPNLLEITNPGVASFVVDGLAPGSYFFVISAVDASDNESQASNEASGILP